MNLQFDDLVRKAALGTLTADEQSRLDTHLRDHPERRADLAWDHAFAEQLEAKVAAMPAMPGWERTEQLLQTGQAASIAPGDARSTAGGRARGPGLLDRLSDWLASFGLTVNTQAFALALLLVQAGVIGLFAWQHSQETEFSQTRAGTADPTPHGPLLRVSFRPDLRESDLRRALAEVGGEIVGGPGQIGIYLVRVKDGDLGAAAQRLRAGGATELVELVEGR
jgi:hypothetical protein